MAKIIIEIVGWIGAVLILLAYFLITHKDISARSKPYQIMNLIGSILVGVNAFFNRAYPSFIINFIWMVIAIYGFYHIYNHSKRKIKKRYS